MALNVGDIVKTTHFRGPLLVVDIDRLFVKVISYRDKKRVVFPVVHTCCELMIPANAARVSLVYLQCYELAFDQAFTLNEKG